MKLRGNKLISGIDRESLERKKKKVAADTKTVKALQKHNPPLNFLLIRNISLAEGIEKKKCPPSSFFLEVAITYLSSCSLMVQLPTDLHPNAKLYSSTLGHAGSWHTLNYMKLLKINKAAWTSIEFVRHSRASARLLDKVYLLHETTLSRLER